MTLSKEVIAQLAEHVENAELNKKAITKITDDYPDMDWEDAYAIQYAIRKRKQDRGTLIAGLKMGLTSHAKMKQMGVETPVFGFLTDYGSYADGAEIDTSNFIHPRIEGEVAVMTNKTLKGPGCHIGSVLAAIDFVMPAIEIIDSRYENFRFDLKSVIADNTSAAGYVTGSNMKRIEELDLPTLGVVLEKNGEIVELGAGAAVLGHPAASVAMLANMLAERGEEISAGTFIMTGGITAAVAVEKGDNINMRCQDIGSVSMRFV
ncbi:MAG: 2-oxo-3-hexenedioate decarboxylase [Gammaproteobacteria bacterium]|jgi:2-oxo-3-hexenedioate decarboxylase|nr:2-oxo-3-hexenedioate decarboxylase [Gammaproteobacteria bacterium]